MASADYEKIKRYIREKHALLFLELSKYIAPTITQTWDNFMFYLNLHIPDADLAQCKNILNISEILLKKGDISYGKYDVLSKAFHHIDEKNCYDVVAKCTKEIEEAQTKLQDEALDQTLSTEEKKSQVPLKIRKMEGKKVKLTEKEPQDKANELVKALRKGQEPRYDLRLIVMGHLKSGKTTTIKRLLRVVFDMETTESTNGIVVIKKGGIRLKDGNWLEKIVADDPKKEILKRMKTTLSKLEKDSEKFAKDDGSATSAADLTSSYQDYVKQSKKDQASSNKKAVDDAAEIFQIAIGEDICYLMIWDFAGQAIFNSCHQMFMSHKAIYLLAFDISKKLDDEIEDDDVHRLGTQQRMSLKEFTQFLLSSIHMYHGQEKNAFPKVFIIGTHGDLVDQKVAEARMEELKQEISRTPILQRHIVGDFIVNNKNPDDTALTRLKQAIFEKAQQEPHWGEYIPATWMPLEKEILSQRDDKRKRVLTLKEIRKLNRGCYVNLESDDEIEAFLAFQNSLGNMMFFGGNASDDIVILDPQWLIDSLKQIITHEQFYIRPEGLDLPWKEFTESAKLYKKLLEAVWENNKDKSFIEHKEKLLKILDSTDIVCKPKVYNAKGLSEELDYLFVPSMLKANKEGTQILQAFKKNSQGRSTTLCFVFKDNFMPPAIFARVQAACIKEFRIKNKSDENFIFQGASVFKLTRLYDLHLEKCQHTLQVTITSVQEQHINSQLCRSILIFFEETLLQITSLYHGINQASDLPFYKAIRCDLAENKLDAWLPWEELRVVSKYHCKKHDPDKWHIIETSDILGIWFPKDSSHSEEIGFPDTPKSIEGPVYTQRACLNMQDLGRLGRLISRSTLCLAASTVFSKAEIDRVKIENTDNAVDQNFAILMNWNRKTRYGINISEICQALADAGNNVSVDSLKQALANKDYTECFKDIPDDFLDSVPNDRSVDQICQRTGREYRQLAIELCLSPVIIERVIMEEPKVIDRTRALLREWMFSHGAAATYRTIGRAIVEVGMDISIIYDCYCAE